jgi:hypothetical protein
VAAKAPVQQLVIQVGQNPPMEMPTGAPGEAPARFERPDPKKLVGREEIEVPAGKFQTQHYRDETPQGTVDLWVSEDVPPMGIVRVRTTPKEGAAGPGAGPMPGMTMELSAQGKGARPQITAKPRPFDPAAFGAMMGGQPPAPAQPRR